MTEKDKRIYEETIAHCDKEINDYIDSQMVRPSIQGMGTWGSSILAPIYSTWWTKQQCKIALEENRKRHERLPGENVREYHERVGIKVGVDAIRVPRDSKEGWSLVGMDKQSTPLDDLKKSLVLELDALRMPIIYSDSKLTLVDTRGDDLSELVGQPLGTIVYRDSQSKWHVYEAKTMLDSPNGYIGKQFAPHINEGDKKRIAKSMGIDLAHEAVDKPLLLKRD